jgi:hypothetical protein
MLCDPRLSEPTLQSGPAMFFYSSYIGLKSETTGQPRGTRNVHQVLFNLKFHWISPSQAFIPSEGISDPIGPNDVFVNQHNHHDHHCYYLQWVDWTKTLHMLGERSTTEMHPQPLVSGDQSWCISHALAGFELSVFLLPSPQCKNRWLLPHLYKLMFLHIQTHKDIHLFRHAKLLLPIHSLLVSAPYLAICS